MIAEETGSGGRSAQTFRLTLAVVLTVALGLRVARLTTGLPDFLEEAIPFRIALGMVDPSSGRLDLDPHFFNYPSLVIYLHFVVQQGLYLVGKFFGVYRSYADYVLAFQLDPTPMVVAARWIGIVADLSSVVAVMVIARRFGNAGSWMAGLIVASAPILVVTSSSIFTDSVMMALGLWAIDRFLAWDDTRRERDLFLGAALVGFASSAKYPAAALLVPFSLLVVARTGRLSPRLLVISVAIAILTFVATSPFVAIDFASFWRDFRFESAHASNGHFGSTTHLGLGFLASRLFTNLGGVGLLFALASVAAIWRTRRSAATAVPAVALLAMGLPIAFARIEAERYVAILIALSAILAAASLPWILGRAPARMRALCTVFLVAAGCAQPVMGGARVAWMGADTTQRQARRWCERALPSGAVLLQEGYSARLFSELAVTDMRAGTLFMHASEHMQRQWSTIRTFRAVSIPLAVSGAATSAFDTPHGAIELPVFPHAEYLNAIYYQPELFANADYVMTSSAVRARFEADPVRFGGQCAVYRELGACAPVVARFRARGRVEGPEIVVYRITDAARSRLLSGGGVDACWWTKVIPAEYRSRASHALGTLGDPSPCDDHASTPWVRSLASLYSGRVRIFAQEFATSLALSGRWAPAAALSLGTLVALPQDSDACLMYSVCAGRLGNWRDARTALETTLRSGGRTSGDPALRLQYARALQQTGSPILAEHEARAVIASTSARDPLSQQAAAVLRGLGTDARHPK